MKEGADLHLGGGGGGFSKVQNVTGQRTTLPALQPAAVRPLLLPLRQQRLPSGTVKKH